MNPYRRMILSGLLIVGCAAGRVEAAALDPTLPLFMAQSQGDVSLTSGSYQFELGSNTPSLVYLNGPTFTTVATGFIYNGINVFDFHSLDIAAGANISTLQSAASGPIALLASTSINMAGSIDVSGGQQYVGSSLGGGPGAGNTGVGGVGGGVGIPLGGEFGVIVSGGGGGGFGGIGQRGQDVPYQFGPPLFQSGVAQGGAGGAHYESLADHLQGGSAGGLGAGATGYSILPGAGGLGGGAIELGAVGTVSVSGSITANGSNGFDALNGVKGPAGGGGGGSGGGVFLHGDSVDLSGTISALGGAGGSGRGFNDGGGAGSGGLVLAQYNNAYGTFSDTGTVNVGNDAYAGRFDVQSVPEPSSLILLGMSALGGVVATGLRCRRR